MHLARLTLLAAAAVATRPACAQVVANGTRIAGVAVSPTGEQIVGAQVRVIGSVSPPATTGEDGTFELFVLNDTTPRLVVRRIGFKPETVSVHLPRTEATPLTVRMSRTIQMIRPVVVNASQIEPNSSIAQMRERERTSGNGYFTYRKDFMKFGPANFSDVLRRIPGVRVQRVNGFTEVRLRNNRCRPLYWVDGQSLLGIPFDPDFLPPETIEAVEIYSSASLVPPQFQGPPSAQGCGSVVIWTRSGERPVRRPTIDADSIVRLLDAQRLFLASEVERPARIVSIQQPEYPDSLRAAGVSGSAVIEFIVDADGKLEKESIGVVSATHLRFADAVRVAVLDASFLPAMKDGHPVAQVYQLPVTFTAPQGPGKP